MEASQLEFRRVFAEHQRAVYAYCLRRTNPDDALDAAAEVFLTAWRRRDAMPDGPLPWLYGIARNVVAHQWRGNRRRRRLGLQARALIGQGPESPEAVVVQREEYAQVLAALGRLRSPDQEVLRLAAWDELPHPMIADLLGCSVNAVDQRIHRAKRRLAKQYRSLARNSSAVGASAPATEEGVL